MLSAGRLPRVLASLLVAAAALAAPASPAAGAPGPAHASPSREQVEAAASLCRRGGAALGAGDLAGAAAAFEQALRAVPGFPDAHVGLGRIATLQGRHEAALQEYRAAEDGWRALAAALQELRMRRYRAAQEDISDRRDALAGKSEGDINTSLQNLPGMPHASDTTRAARLELEISRLRAAEQGLNDAALSEPPAEVYFLQGNALHRLGRYDEALERWGLVVRRAPGFGPVYNNMAEACLRLGRLDEARAHLRRAEELGVPVNPEFKRKLGL